MNDSNGSRPGLVIQQALLGFLLAVRGKSEYMAMGRVSDNRIFRISLFMI